MADDEWIHIYGEGVDDLFGTGIPAGSVVLISGTPGTMKSTLGFNILYRNAVEHGLKGVYVSLEQSKRSLCFQLSQMGMDPDDVAEHVVIYDRDRLNKELSILDGYDSFTDGFMQVLTDLRLVYGCDLLVLDSLNIFEIVAKYENPRLDIFSFFDHLRKFGATSFLISEMSMDSKAYCFNNEDFLADGVIYLGMKPVNAIDVERQIRIVKLRGTKHDTSYSRIVFEHGEFFIYREISG